MIDQSITFESKVQWFEEIMDTYGTAIQRLVFTYVKEYSTAEDLTQEIFLKVYRKIHTFQHDSSLKTWVYRIAINHCKDYLRSWYCRHIVVNDQVDHHAVSDGVRPDQQLIKKVEEEHLVQLVFTLPVIYRESIYLYYYEDLTIKMISQLTGAKENTVKGRLKRGKALLKKQLEQEGYHEGSFN